MPETVVVRSAGGGRELRTRCVPEVATLAEGLLAELEKHAEQWRDGYGLQPGWGPLVLREEGDGFVVTAPDYAGDPRSELTDDITLAIWMSVSLTAAPRAARLEPRDIAWDDDVICAIGWEQADRLQLSRIETTTPGDSGWFIDAFPSVKEGELEAHEMVRLPAWRILQLRRAAARAMALPPTVKVVVDGDRIQAIVRTSDGAVLNEAPL